MGREIPLIHGIVVCPTVATCPPFPHLSRDHQTVSGGDIRDARTWGICKPTIVQEYCPGVDVVPIDVQHQCDVVWLVSWFRVDLPPD
eukprot:4625914-Pyramimonas_sp.AAC.1